MLDYEQGKMGKFERTKVMRTPDETFESKSEEAEKIELYSEFDDLRSLYVKISNGGRLT